MLQLRKVLRVTGLRPFALRESCIQVHCHGILCSITLHHEFPKLRLAIDVTSGGIFFQTASFMPDRVKEAFYGSVLSTVFSPPYTHTAPSDMLDEVKEEFYAPEENLQGKLTRMHQAYFSVTHRHYASNCFRTSIHTAPSDMLDEVKEEFYAPQENLQGKLTHMHQAYFSVTHRHYASSCFLTSIHTHSTIRYAG